ncbi:MAG: hypothetical protein ACYCPS_04230 [Candidatus Saccharimonadales bacterium]
MKSNTLYGEVVEKTAVYLGASADRFISRQIVGHLDKSPEKLMAADLKQLIKWIKPAIALLTDNPEAVDEYIKSLHELAGKPKRSLKNA